MEDSSCLFCKIVSGRIPCYIIHEDEHFLAFLDLAQFTEGHTIAVPKIHATSIWDVPNIGDYYAFIQKIGNHFKRIGFQYVDTMSFGRMVPHSHVHIVPHNLDSIEWKNALSVLGGYQHDPSRRPTPDKGAELVKKFSF